MNNIQDMLSLLPPIITEVSIVVALLTVVIQLIEKSKELWSISRPATKYLLWLTTQVIPIGMVIWYYMYWAVEYSERFTEPGVFLLLIAEPTVIVVCYEVVWGTWLYPKILSLVGRSDYAQKSLNKNPSENANRNQVSNPQATKNTRRRLR